MEDCPFLGRPGGGADSPRDESVCRPHERCAESPFCDKWRNMTEEVILIHGGSIRCREAGEFNDETGKIVSYDKAVVLEYAGKSYRIHPTAVSVLIDAVRTNKSLQDFIGVASGPLARLFS